jgi:uncharacterized membrane protein YqaE (UPF0057 family)
MSLLAMPIRTAPHAVPLWQEALFLMYLGVAAVFMFLPTWVALWRRRSGAGRIFLVNLLLGWTLIGWVLALIFAFRDPERTVTEPYICRNCHTVSMPTLPGRQWFFGTGHGTQRSSMAPSPRNYSVRAATPPTPFLSIPLRGEKLPPGTAPPQHPSSVCSLVF